MTRFVTFQVASMNPEVKEMEYAFVDPDEVAAVFPYRDRFNAGKQEVWGQLQSAIVFKGSGQSVRVPLRPEVTLAMLEDPEGYDQQEPIVDPQPEPKVEPLDTDLRPPLAND